MDNTKPVEISDDLIKDAELYLARLPQTAEDVIEHWARIGQVVAGQLTESEALNLLLGNCEVTVEQKSKSE